ncbi:purine or other phosphorylase family 1 [Isosphaera pallida ATCC 43644]|uniref:Purine or other phosphorylase family 1 n=1 Tax=Isosphaera pallida (strain ATCC 43644 / DSM 9630 / IS1B) TaxID=575540 RepID=E8R5V4_ISOPI|nr:purine phosphorylase [Isosphaera pallida]ADV62861.1 purine or other phosphorylase family 1 [Isosphaera pallida ATCC 43644]
MTADPSASNSPFQPVGSTAMGSSEATSNRRVCDLGLVAALGSEVGAILDALSERVTIQGRYHRVIEGQWNGRGIALVLAGVGRDHARAATRFLLTGHAPNLVVSLGFAGALRPDAARFSVWTIREALDPEGHRFPLRPPPVGPFPTATLATVDRLLTTPQAKAQLRHDTGADLVDMETSAVAEICHQWSQPLLGLRVVSDAVDDPLPSDLAAVLAASTTPRRLGAVAASLWHRPGRIKDYWNLYETSLEAAERLAHALQTAIPPPRS